MTLDDEVIEWLREAASEAHSWESVRAALQQRDADGEDERLRAFIFAFGYHLHEAFSGARERAGEPFGAQLAGEGWRFPPALADIDETHLQAWREALDAVDEPVVQARLADLLWERKAPPTPHLFAASAISALLSVSEDEAWSGMERVLCLSRALEIARQTNDKTRSEDVIEALLAFARADLAASDGGPGLSLGALRTLVALPAAQRPAALDGLLEQTGQKYGADPYIVSSVADLRSPLLDENNKRELRGAQVREWRARAGEVSGMLRVHRLEVALEIARTHGCQEQVAELRRELGAIGADELELKEISAELQVPADEIERFLASFSDAPDWRHALGLLAAQPAPGGTPEQLEEEVKRMMEEFPVQFLFGKSLIGPDNATAIFRAHTPEQHERLAAAEQRAQHARIWGMYCARALVRVGERDDRPDRAQLTELLHGDFIDEETAERVARAVELYWDGQYDESAHVLVSRIERIVREIARQIGIPVVREPQPGREVGGVEMLGNLLREMRGVFPDAAWHAYLLNVLADPLGLNLRNSIAHGLHGTVGAVDASLLMQAALFLSGLSIGTPPEPAEPPPGSGPA